MLSGLSSYLFGSPTEEEHPAAATMSAANLARDSGTAPDLQKNTRLRTSDADDDWTFVDKSSRGSSPLSMEEHPMENLLIEHPSMSVYQYRGGRPNSRGADSDDSESELARDMDTAPSNRSRHMRSRSARVAADGGTASAAAMKSKKAAQQAQKRKEGRQVSRHQLQRSNKVLKYNSASKAPRRKHHMSTGNSNRNNDRKCQY